MYNMKVTASAPIKAAAVALVIAGLMPALSVRADTAVQGVDSQRLATAAARMIPLGKVLESVAAADPQWPITDKPGAMNATQLACVRANMGSSQFNAVMLKRAEAYTRENPARAADDLRLLEGGGGQLFARMVDEGVNAGLEKRELDMAAIIASSKPEEIAGMMTLANDARYQPLRDLIGFNRSIGSGSEGKQAGEAAAVTFMMPMLMDAMTTCNVPVSALLK